MSRPLTVAVLGTGKSAAARAVAEAAAGPRVRVVATSAGGVRRFLAAVSAAQPDLVVIDPAVRGSRAIGEWLRARGQRVLRAGREPVDVADMAAAAARPGAGLDTGPDVSVVAPVLNEVAVIDELVADLTAQMRATDELVVVDGGSTDGTAARLESLAAAEPRLRVLSAPGATIAKGRNTGIRAARHEVLVCTDAGCTRAPGWLDALRVAFAEEPPPALVSSAPGISSRSALERAQAAACYPDPQEVRRPTLLARVYGELFGVVFHPTLPRGLSMAFTREAWSAAGGFPEEVGWTEDSAFARRVARHGRCLVTADAEILWQQRGSLRATYEMYRRYGIGGIQSGDPLLRIRDAVRALAYGAGLAVLATAPRRAAPLMVAAGAVYISLPLRRLARAGTVCPEALLLPVAMVTKDVAKVHGAIEGAVSMRRRRRGPVRGGRT